MYLTFPIKKNILSAAILAAALFAAGYSAHATDKPRAGSADQPKTAPAPKPAEMAPAPAKVGEVEIPAVGILATRVLEGDDAHILKLAVGHIPGTAVPGPSGNVGLAAHNNTFFRPLQNIKVGDEIHYTTAAGAFTYRVVSLQVVLPTAIEVLNSTQQPTMTLVTCYPFNSVGPAPKRLIVHAELVPPSQPSGAVSQNSDPENPPADLD